MSKANLFVFIQFAAIGGLLLTGTWLPQPPALLALLAAGVALGAWAMLSMGFGNFGVSPLPLAEARFVARGPYAYIRHPMYTGLLLATLALVLAAPSPLRVMIWLVLLADLVLKLHYEEGLLAAKFPQYTEYQKRTKKLVPFIY
ncbi:MAG TPA: methyltransferase [Anaerolineales bacterium]|nr:methyltransferase [Anaerolineales bacterium]HRQ91859.1 methyltransferase [Anaerolineales bacterium]